MSGTLMVSPCCATCRFFAIGTTTAFPEAQGQCRRYAPQGPTLRSGGGWQAFPPMAAWHWCGEHVEVRGPIASAKRWDSLREWLDAQEPKTAPLVAEASVPRVRRGGGA